MTTDTIDDLRAMEVTLPSRFAEEGDHSDIWTNDSSVSAETNLYNGFTAEQALPVAYEWESGKNYSIGEFVIVNDVKYVCVVSHTSSEENIPPNDDFWELSSDATGRPVLRQDVNALGYLCTDETFYQMCGGVYEYDPEVAQAINGYPEGAVLSYFDEDGMHRYVKCIKSGGNCMVDYRTNGPDDINWKIVSGDVPEALNICRLPSNVYTETLSSESDPVWGQVITITSTGLCYIFTNQITYYDPYSKIIVSSGGTQKEVSIKNAGLNIIPVSKGMTIQAYCSRRYANQPFSQQFTILYP